MQEAPLISVVIPAYNVEKYIHKCLNSILNQGMENIEILVYDDGSVDRTFQVIEKFRDEKIKIFRGDKNKGVVYARNFLLNKARGAFIAFQDADDWSHKDRLYLQLNFLRSRPHIGSCGTQFVKVVDNKPIYYSDFPCDAYSIREAIPRKFHFLPGSLTIRKSVLEKVGLYNPFFGNDGNEDIYFTSKIILTSGFENIDSHLYYYNLNLKSLTKLGYLNNRKIYISEINQVLLNELINQGTNILESGDYDKLACLENQFQQNYKDIKTFTLFEKVIGQLIFYKQYELAIKEIINYMVRTLDILNSVRLLMYVIRKSLRYES